MKWREGKGRKGGREGGGREGGGGGLEGEASGIRRLQNLQGQDGGPLEHGFQAFLYDLVGISCLSLKMKIEFLIYFFF
jgi:hypothetical protein